jgi:hypothetical protein|tara:strand:- start:7775 stop:9436 length:1662 start_codon:yes stop_codon:yes gene_type:complete
MSKKILVWDVTANFNDYPDIIKAKYKKLYFNRRKKFCKWVGLLSKDHLEDIDWWVSPPASRNLYSSNLYKYICILETIDFFLKKKIYLLDIKVDSIKLQKTIRLNFHKTKVNVNLKKSIFLHNKFFFYLHYIKVSVFFLFQFFFIKIFSKNFFHSKSPYTLIDTFVIDCKYKHKFYYGDLINFFSKKNNLTFFIPTFVTTNLSNFFEIFKATNKDKNYIFKENFTEISDVMFCITYIFRIKKFNKRFTNYLNFNLDALVKEEINSNRDILGIFLSLYNFRFARRLKLKSIKLTKVVNWFENQSLDKGWNIGFRKFHPNIKTIGYQGFTSQPEYMNTIPTYYEKINKTIPDTIVVISKNYIKAKKEFCKNLNIIDGPALRFADLFKFTKNYKRKFEIVIFLEGASHHTDKEIILKFLKVSKLLSNLKFYIKPHPSLSLEKLKLRLPNNFIILNDKFSLIAKKTYLAVSHGNTSVTLESLAYGCKLLVPVDNLFDRYNLNNLNIPSYLYRVCNNQYDLVESINYFLKNIQASYKGVDIKNKLFNKVTKKNVKILI